MSPAQDTKKTRKVKSFNDVYTAILGLAFLVLLATTGYVCFSGLDMYESIFRATMP